MWKACKTMGPPPKTMPQKVMPPSLTAPIALFVVAPCFVFGVVIRCAMKLLPCKILGDARKSRRHAVFERCPERCPNDARPDGSRPAKSTWPKPLAVQRHAGLTYSPPHQPSTSHCQCTRSCPTIRSWAGPALPSMLPRAPRCASQAPYTACAYCDARAPCEKKSWWSRARIWTRGLTVISRML